MHVMSRADWRYYLKNQIEGAKLCHVNEALAFAAGFKTHAALLASGEEVPFKSHDREKFIQRMTELGHTVPNSLQFL